MKPSIISMTYRSALVAGVALSCFLVDRPPAFAQAAWQVGNQRLLVNGPSAAPLTIAAFGAAGLTSPDILGRIGGVNIEGVAVLSPAPAGAGLSIRYDAGAPDGRRLEITEWGTSTHFSLPDWELKPIAMLADSNYTADVSLFGDGPDEQHYDYIQFNPVLKDTLLGLRILQADMMMADPENLSDVPKWNGHAVLGLGEQMPSAGAATTAADNLLAITSQYPIQSWILTDINTQTLVQKTDGMVSIKASPYYYFWTSAHYRLEFQHHQLEAEKTLAKTHAETAKINGEIADVENEQNKLDAETQDRPPEALAEVTNQLQQRQDVLSELNPLVWNAIQDTTRYTALLRYVKQNDPADWSRFIGEMRAVSISPAVQTPTMWQRS